MSKLVVRPNVRQSYTAGTGHQLYSHPIYQELDGAPLVKGVESQSMTSLGYDSSCDRVKDETSQHSGYRILHISSVCVCVQ